LTASSKVSRRRGDILGGRMFSNGCCRGGGIGNVHHALSWLKMKNGGRQ
jgi:hypothetical protein